MPRSSIVNGRVSKSTLPSMARARTAPAACADASVDSGKLYVAAIESSIHAFITIDLNGLITSWSAGAERMFGYAACDMVKRPIDLIVPASEDLQLAAARARIA